MKRKNFLLASSGLVLGATAFMNNCSGPSFASERINNIVGRDGVSKDINRGDISYHVSKITWDTAHKIGKTL